MADSLPRHEEIVCADRPSHRFEIRAEFAHNARVGVIEWEDQNRAREESFKSLAIEMLFCTLGDTVPEFKECDGRDEDMRSCGRGIVHMAANARRVSVD